MMDAVPTHFDSMAQGIVESRRHADAISDRKEGIVHVGGCGKGREGLDDIRPERGYISCLALIDCHVE